MRYLTLAEALAVAEAVTGLNPVTLEKASRLELVDSALHAPQAGFGDEDFYPAITQKAAVLAVRIARNHPRSSCANSALIAPMSRWEPISGAPSPGSIPAATSIHPTTPTNRTAGP